ncbi:MAG: Crp/Fnr family transcriptional regulator [Bacteroidales bacterium]|nr:Crp/Fnr family transcriptional regulator [Candidatus Liminaster caballi]
MTEQELAKGLKDIWDLLTEPQQQAVVANMVSLPCSKGDYIYHNEEESVYLYCMIRGCAKLEKFGIGGRNQIMRMFQPGDIFGFRSYFALQEHTTEVVAIENSLLACIPMTLIERLCFVNADLAMYFVRSLAVELGNSDQRTVDLTQKHIRARLADSLIFLSDKYGYESDGITLNIYLSREELASLSNMTTSNAIRTLASFCTEGIISTDGRRIKVLDLMRLKHINAQG